MTEPGFFTRGQGLTLGEIASLTGAAMRAGSRPDVRVNGVAALDRAGPNDLTFIDRAQYENQLAETRAGVCIVGERFVRSAPAHLNIVTTKDPYRAFVLASQAMFPQALRPSSLFEATGTAVGANLHPSARLESGVSVDPGAVVRPRAEIGAGTVIGAGAVIGPDVRIGRHCAIGPGAAIVCALLGDRVIVHSGCRIGQDGFGYVGYVGDAAGQIKIPQVGRVIIQDDVEIGAGTTIDRGAMRDTVIGEGSKIDNLVQIGHNVTVGRHCVLVAQTGIAGSATLEDYVMLGARVGVNNHVTIGEGAQIVAVSVVHGDVPPGARWGGTPAKPTRIWFREMKLLERLAAKSAQRNPDEAGSKE